MVLSFRICAVKRPFAAVETDGTSSYPVSSSLMLMNPCANATAEIAAHARTPKITRFVFTDSYQSPRHEGDVYFDASGKVKARRIASDDRLRPGRTLMCLLDVF